MHQNGEPTMEGPCSAPTRRMHRHALAAALTIVAVCLASPHPAWNSIGPGGRPVMTMPSPTEVIRANQSSRVSNGCSVRRATLPATVPSSAPPGRKVRSVVTLSSPHHGSPLAGFLSTLLNQGEWFTYVSGNIIEELKQQGTPPARINSIRIYASGHNYQSMVSEVDLRTR